MLVLLTSGCGDSANGGAIGSGGATGSGGVGGLGGIGGMGGTGGSPDYYPYLDTGSNALEAKYRVTAVQAQPNDSRRSDGLPVALVVEVRDAVARTSAIAGGGVLRWNEPVLRGSAASLATTWSVRIVTPGPGGDTVIGECRVEVSPAMITEWGAFETIACGEVSNLLFRFDMKRKRLL